MRVPEIAVKMYCAELLTLQMKHFFSSITSAVFLMLVVQNKSSIFYEAIQLATILK